MHKLSPIFVILLILSLIIGNVGLAKADSTVVVTPTNLGNWSFHQFVPTGTGAITDGPGTPPMGLGSARLTTSTNGGMSLRSNGYFSTRLDTLTRLEYSSYRATSDPSNNRSVTLQLEVDYDIDDPDSSKQGWLVYEPYRTAGAGNVMEDIWYTWDALNGKWYATDTPGTTICPQNNPCTITQLLSSYPDVGIRHNGYVQFVAGSAWGLAFTGHADALTIGVNGVNTTFDFELNDQPIVSAGGPYSGDEGSNVSLNGTATDLDGDQLSYTWSYTPGLDVDSGATCTFGDASALSTTFSCTDDGLFNLTLSVSDGVNPAASDNTTATLGNLDPAVNINSPAEGTSFFQGQQVDFSAQVEDSGDNDTLTCQVDWGDGASEDGVLIGDSCTASHQYSQPGVYTPTATTTDDDGGTHSDTTGITVLNVAPTVDITSPLDGDSFSTGSSLDLTADVSDPGVDDQLTCTVDWGDGETSDGIMTAGVCSASHTYAQPSGYLITVNVGDNHGESGSDTVSITVTNLAPTAEAGGPYTGGEGRTINISGSASDPEGNSLTYAWTYSPGSGVDAGTSCTFADPAAAVTSLSCTDNGSFTLTLTVEDGFNPPVIDSATLTLSNRAPVVIVNAPTDGSIFSVGEGVALAASFTDGGSNDTHTCKIAWGDGTTTSGSVAGGICSATHIYIAPGDFTLTATVKDDDLRSGSDSVGITVNAAPNSPPALEAGGPYTGGEGQPVNLTASADDPDEDALNYSWTYLSSEGVDPGTTCTFGNPAALATTFTCSDDGQFTLTLAVDDGHNPPVSDTASITVDNLPPVVTINEPGEVLTYVVGEAVNLDATFINPGGNDAHTCQINWGDGTTTDGLVSGNTCTGSHVYTGEGEYTLTATISDDDSSSGSASVDLTIATERQPAVFLPLMNKIWNSNH